MSTMRERFVRFVETNKRPGVSVEEVEGLIVQWCESEVRLALAPREQSQALADAESIARKWRDHITPRRNITPSDLIATINELDRLRGLVRSLGGEP
jgi:hypothetical protein